MSSLLSIDWTWLIGIAGVIGAIFLSWFTGKSKGTTEAKAKSDVESARADAENAIKVTEKQSETVRAVKDVTQTNQSLSDSDSRERMRNSKYHSAD
ncbi:hypothetical protein [Yokenella regensburgei]|uniref:hypothetical protein n=1 Tax=Yokenella regensburgei TaxID=158877 RepID=UPI001432B824|nr:hypothetical protein [Yokenella regensburgei]QIU92138.1 hypothetical protein HEC60_23830 [Yokenella regensburgei]